MARWRASYGRRDASPLSLHVLFQPAVVSSAWEVCTCRVVRAANARVTAFVGRGHGVVAAWVSYSGVTRPDISSPCISVCSSPVFRDCDVTTVVVSVGISRVVLKPGPGRASLLLGMSQQDELSFRGTAGWRTCDQMLGSLMASGGYRLWGPRMGAMDGSRTAHIATRLVLGWLAWF